MTMPTERLITARDLCALHFVGDPQVSPAGRHVAFVVTTIDEEQDDYRSRIWLVATDGGSAPRPLTAGEKADTAPRWSPDGQQLAFLSTRGGKPQLYLLPLAGGEALPLTDRADGAGEAVWSPDGRQLAFAALVRAAAPATAAEGKCAEAGEPLRITSLKYKFDGRNFIQGKPTIEGRRHLFTLTLPGDLAAGIAAPRQRTTGDWDDDQPAWSPDGQTLAFVSYREPDTDRVFRADLWTVSAAGEDAPRKLTASDGGASGPAWSPDGATIAYFATLDADRPYPTSRVFTIPADGGVPRSLAPELDRDANGVAMTDLTLPGGGGRPVWDAAGEQLLFLVADGGDQGVYRVPATGGAATPLLTGERTIASLALGAGVDSPLVFNATAGAHPAELFIVAADGSGERQLTDLNGPFLARKAVSPPERLRFKGGDEHEIDGWLIPPTDPTPGERYPLILMIHGGPHTQYCSAFMHEFQFLAAQGYGVVYANPHGSTGRGAAFAKELTACWGEKDLPDLLAAVDHVLARGEADPERLGVGGGSYGGFMTNWILGHSDRFKAAVTMRSISNLLNFWGTSDIFHIANIPEFGIPWEEPERYLKFSPIMYAANFVTPTLILHQEEDHRCPVEQGEQLFTALSLREVPTRFVRFPAESHGMSRNGKPGHRFQRLEELRAWYARFLQPGSAAGGAD